MAAFFALTLHLQGGLDYSPMKTALAMLPATVGIIAGNGIGMPLAARLGRGLPMIGLALLVAGSVTMIFVVTHYGADLTPWQLAGPVVLYGAGLFAAALLTCLLLPRRAESGRLGQEQFRGEGVDQVQ